MKLQVLPLSQEAFSAYGDVIETQQRDFFHINNGLVERYGNDSNLLIVFYVQIMPDDFVMQLHRF
ncbi:hypothetical protein VEE17_30590 [Escherichia coli]|nr:hypothetical protein VEE41_09740 [Escherichia coli]BEB63734.1 hypothetical protein VEE17_30590 [Escherichia coli]